MSGKKPKYNKNITYYNKSSININKIKEIKADSNVNISSFNDNNYKYITSLTPSREVSTLDWLNDSPGFRRVKKTIDERIKTPDSEVESANQANNKDNDDNSSSDIAKYNLEIKKEQKSLIHDSNFKDHRTCRIEQQLYGNCDRNKISKELELLLKKLKKSDKLLSNDNKSKSKHQYNDSISDDNNNNKKLMLGNKKKHFNDKKDDRITSVDSSQICLNNSVSQRINDTKSLKEQKKRISKAIEEAKKNINNEELILTSDENVINDEIHSFYSKEANHNSKKVLQDKRKKT